MTSHARLTLFAAGLLDPPDAAEVEDQLLGSAALRRQLAALGAPPRWTLSPWRVPPPALGVPMRVASLEAFSTQTLRAGDAFHADLPDLPDASEREVVVLRRSESLWEVLAPLHAEDRARLSDFPLVDGLRRVTLLARGTGRQRWAIALPRWAADRDLASTDAWADLRASLQAGDVPVGSVDLELQ